jgi:hypothetical protein
LSGIIAGFFEGFVTVGLRRRLGYVHEKAAQLESCAASLILGSGVLFIRQDFASGGVEINVKLFAIGSFEFHFIFIAVEVVIQVGVVLDQLRNLVDSYIRLGQASGEGQGGSGEQGSQSFHLSFLGVVKG